MNKVRRQAISDLQNELEVIREKALELGDEEQEYLDNMPESLQSSDKYSVAESAVDSMTSAVDSIQEAIDSLGEAQQ